MPLWLTEAQSSKSREIVRDTIEDFSELYPQVQVFIKFFPSRQLLEPFEEQVRRGAGPDLVLVFSSTRILQLIQTGALQSLENYQVERAAFRPEALKEVLYRGQLYGLPLFLSTQVLCYNKDLVQELPRTLSELIKVARRGYSVGLHSGFVEAFWGTGIFGGRLFDDRGRIILAE
ncbi:MAG: extracellular solute-binding protein, partial [Xenococcaceae cyanobacterium MO_234.B1]|nr:extracellular solute-binding protein [Xenococcaceae cyanobacterium MO_234.B1]